jgi:hypothetical protein
MVKRFTNTERTYGMIPITADIAVSEEEIEIIYAGIRTRRQHVNKTATAVQLRFDIKKTASLPDDVRRRLLQFPDRRLPPTAWWSSPPGDFVLRTNLRMHRPIAGTYSEIDQTTQTPTPNKTDRASKNAAWKTNAATAPKRFAKSVFKNHDPR